MVKTPVQPAAVTTLSNFIALCGKTVAWLSVVVVLLTFAVVVLRYGFNLGWIWLQESLTYLHVAIFTIVAAWTLQKDGHVRVDIFYAKMPKKKRALVDLSGTLLFLLPFCIFMLVIAWPYVANSWKLLEASREAGGLPLVFLLKSLMMVMPVLLLGQAFINITDNWRILRSETSS
ncbi:MAG: TRAP transporter small permease subunit [Gammaproteobacteria bacterium]|nr:TRAP transporter small permease subunit [Gammaproteobacteria bacterium]